METSTIPDPTSLKTEDELRAAIVAEAYSWLRTRYHHMGAIKGVGVDCAMILVCVYSAAVPHLVPWFDPRPYEPEWYLHNDEKKYLAGMEQYSHQIEESQVKIGDIAMYNFGRHAAHGAIIVSDEHMIHANRTNGAVELMERRTIAHRLDSYWSIF